MSSRKPKVTSAPNAICTQPSPKKIRKLVSMSLRAICGEARAPCQRLPALLLLECAAHGARMLAGAPRAAQQATHTAERHTHTHARARTHTHTHTHEQPTQQIGRGVCLRGGYRFIKIGVALAKRRSTVLFDFATSRPHANLVKSSLHNE